MKQKDKYVRQMEILPKALEEAITKLADDGVGSRNERFNNYLRIVGTIYYKCINENGMAHIPYPLAKEYWRMTVGGKYKIYIDELVKNKVISKDKNGRSIEYAISFNLVLQFSELAIVPYRLDSKIKSENLPLNNNLKSIEERLGKRIIKDLNKVAFDVDLYHHSIRNSEIINPDDFSIDISKFPSSMSFAGEIHFPSEVKKYDSLQVKTLLKYKQKLNVNAYYDKDRIKLIDKKLYKLLKKNSFNNHTKLNFTKLNHRHYELSRDENKTRRVFHVGVFLPNKALQYVTIDGEPVIGIDASTSQFLLLANLFNCFSQSQDSVANAFSGKRKTFIKKLYSIFKQVSQNIPDTTDMNEFFTDVVERDFYEEMRKALKLNQRSQAKIFCFSILFSRSDTKNTFKDIIAAKYPTVIETINKYKKEMGYKQLSINLQALEAEIFVDNIYQNLHKNNIPSFTRHDSVIVPENQVELAQEICTEIYESYGFISKFKIEDYRMEDEEVDIELMEIINRINCPDDIEYISNKDLIYLLSTNEHILTEDECNDLTSVLYENAHYDRTLDDDNKRTLYKIITHYNIN